MCTDITRDKFSAEIKAWCADEFPSMLPTLRSEIEAMRDWSLGNGQERRDWKRVAMNWIRRKAKEQSNGKVQSRRGTGRRQTITEAAENIARDIRSTGGTPADDDETVLDAAFERGSGS